MSRPDRLPGPLYRRRGSRLARAAAGFGSLLAIVGLSAGLPAALYLLGGSPIPRALPSLHLITVTLTRPDNGALFLGAVRWVSWLAWALFVISALAEVISRVRGRPSSRLPVISSVQGLAAALVGTALLGLLPGQQMPRASASLLGFARLAVTAPPYPGRPRAGQPVPTVPATVAGSFSQGARPGHDGARPGGPRRELYRVADGDNLWDIAARRLGDGERWPEIYALNRGRPQPGGGYLTDPSLIYPGWILLLPAYPSGHPAPSRSPSCPPARTAPRQLPGPRHGVSGTPDHRRNSPHRASSHQAERSSRPARHAA